MEAIDDNPYGIALAELLSQNQAHITPIKLEECMKIGTMIDLVVAVLEVIKEYNKD